MGYTITKIWEELWCQLCRHCWHCSVSSEAKLASWHLTLLSNTYISFSLASSTWHHRLYLWCHQWQHVTLNSHTKLASWWLCFQCIHQFFCCSINMKPSLIDGPTLSYPMQSPCDSIVTALIGAVHIHCPPVLIFGPWMTPLGDPVAPPPPQSTPHTLKEEKNSPKSNHPTLGLASITHINIILLH